MAELKFWKPEEAPGFIEGTLIGAYKIGKGHSIKLDDTFVNLTLMISNNLKGAPQKVKCGDKVRIEYTGTEKGVKYFDVYVNGAKCDPNAPVELSGAIDAAIEAGRKDD